MFQAIKRFFLSALRFLWSTIKKVISGALEKFLADSLELAKEIVKNLVNSDLSNEDKRKEAFNQIKLKVIGRGMEYKESWVNILIELALASVKLEF